MNEMTHVCVDVLSRQTESRTEREAGVIQEGQGLMMMMIFIGTLFCNLHRDANGLYLRQTSVQPAL